MAPIADRTKRARTSFEKTAMIDEFVRSGSVDTEYTLGKLCDEKIIFASNECSYYLSPIAKEHFNFVTPSWSHTFFGDFIFDTIPCDRIANIKIYIYGYYICTRKAVRDPPVQSKRQTLD